MKTTIKQAKQHLNQEVTIGAWLTNKRSSGKLHFTTSRWYWFYARCRG